MATFTSQNVKAQAFEEGNIIVSAGYGFPNLVGTLFSVYETYAGYNISSFGPLYFKGEYAVTDNIGVGLALGFSSTTIEYNRESFDAQGDAVTYVDGYTYASSNYLVRVNYHFGDSDKFDPYCGVGMGYRSSKSEFTSTEPGYVSTDLDFPFPFGFETTFGTRYYFTDNIGAYAEVGFAKSIFQIGISAKF